MAPSVTYPTSVGSNDEINVVYNYFFIHSFRIDVVDTAFYLSIYLSAGLMSHDTYIFHSILDTSTWCNRPHILTPLFLRMPRQVRWGIHWLGLHLKFGQWSRRHDRTVPASFARPFCPRLAMREWIPIETNAGGWWFNYAENLQPQLVTRLMMMMIDKGFHRA